MPLLGIKRASCRVSDGIWSSGATPHLGREHVVLRPGTRDSAAEEPGSWPGGSTKPTAAGLCQGLLLRALFPLCSRGKRGRLLAGFWLALGDPGGGGPGSGGGEVSRVMGPPLFTVEQLFPGNGTPRGTGKAEGQNLTFVL